MQQQSNDALWREFGAWIREYRERKHLSQSGAAQRAGIDRQQWYRIENGKSGTRRETVINMAQAVSADVQEALEKAGFSGVEDSRVFEIANRVQVKLGATDLSPDEQKEIAEELALAYEVIMARRKRKKDEE